MHMSIRPMCFVVLLGLLSSASVAGWTHSQQGTEFPSQQSGAHHLEANKRYYIEAKGHMGDVA